MVKAVAVVNGETVNGTIFFSQEEDSPVQVNGQLKGLKQGLHGFHLHEIGERHIDYFGNIEANAEGVAEVSITDKQISLYGPDSIIRRTVMLYANPDDLGKGGHELSKTTCNASRIVACTVIVISLAEPN